MMSSLKIGVHPAGTIPVDSPYGPDQIDAGYPLVGDTARLCFGLTKVPPGKSIEDLFSDAAGRNDYCPLKKLAECFRKADYYLAIRLAGEQSNCYHKFFRGFAGSNFLTFNYDSPPETFVFRLGRWYPPRRLWRAGQGRPAPRGRGICW